MSITENYAQVKKQIPENVTLVAVSKTRTIEEIMQLYELGQRDFGENRVQELLEKQPNLPQDIRWHQIGHLQTNKVKQILPFIHLIHSVDSLKLVQKIQSEAKSNAQEISILLQIKIAKEETKYGLQVSETEDILHKYQNGLFPNLKIKGLMGMASFSNDEEIVKNEFQYLKKLYDNWQSQYRFDTLSMGMSGDFQLAIECGSNMVRVGSKLFEKSL